MCGIAGVMTRDSASPDPSVLDALSAALAHRGPDGRGRHLRDDVGLVHDRLAIIDLATGDQPLGGPDGHCALVANGEIYNYLELRAEMPEARFRTQSDCEPALHLYCRFGTGFAKRLRGMYAIAIHDARNRRLILARDPFGIKPLYFAETPAGFAFASEPQALVAAGLVSPRIDPHARSELLQLQFTTASIFQGIERVAPGETLVVEGGRVVERRQLEPLPAGDVVQDDQDRMLYRLDEVLAESVLLHQRSDVPYGMFLSGGIDSSVLLAMMARLNPRPVLAFTAGFPGTGVHDERELARLLARQVGAEHREVEIGEGDFWRLLPEIAAAVDDPIADYAIVPTYVLAREASRHVKVVLSGEGGDELFAGYGRYRAAMRPWPFARAMRRRGTFDGLNVLREKPAGWRSGIDAAERRLKRDGLSKLQWAQAVDCEHWLPDDLLIKLDRCLMAHGVEGRVPFLDPVVADFAFRLPDGMKVRKGLGKYALRRWLETALPAARPFARKRGFTVPVGEWIARRPTLGPLVARQPAIAEIARPEAVAHLFATGGLGHHAFAAWTLLFYALWHRRHVEGLPPQGDVFDTLAAR